MSSSENDPKGHDATTEPAPPAQDVDKPKEARDAEYWAKAVSRLTVGEISDHAININVQGRRVTSPMQGFGKLWRKTYRVPLTGKSIDPTLVVEEWKANFGSFWPKGNSFYGPLTELSPGDVAVLNLRTGGGVKLSTGVFVLYADDEAFTFMTPEGHQFAAMITFTAYEKEGVTYAQVQPLFRSSDPLFDIVLPIMVRMENMFWKRTLESLARHFEVDEPNVEIESVCLDNKRQWRMAKNVRHNSAIRSGLYAFTIPFRWIARLIRRTGGSR